MSLISCFIQYLVLLAVFSNTRGQTQVGGLTVSIVTDPASEPYPAATWIRFSCHVTGNTSMVMYDWIVLCSSQQPPLVVSTYENYTTVGQFDISLRSTPIACLDTVMCNASDQSGNRGHATWRIGRVTGVGLWGSDFLFNTSAYRANTNGDIKTIYCHSSSFNSSVGQWISPEGQDITRNFTDPFSIQFDNGPDYPSYNTFQLQNPSVQPFTSTYNGVYTCIVPDDQDILQTLHIGIYSNQYSATLAFELDRLGRSSESPITLNCPTTGLLPTVTVWYKNGEQLASGGTYEITTKLRDRKNTTFDNFLHIYQTLQQAEGIYQCIPVSSIDNPTQDHNVTQLDDYYIAMHSVGDSGSITCTLDGVFTYNWYNEEGNGVVSGNVLSYSASDSIHHKLFFCAGLSFITFAYEFLYVKFIINVPPEALEVTAESDDTTPILGQSYSMDCIGYKLVSGLMNQPSPQWFTPNGALLSSSSDVQLQGPRSVGISSELVAQFPTLHTSHAGNYTCQASLSSPARTSPIVKTTVFEVTVQIPSPTVILTVLSSEPHVIGGTFSVLCQATVSHHVNTPVSVDFTWRRTSGLITSDSDSRITISDTTPVSGLSYSSTLTINDLGIGADSQMSYDCEAVVRSDSSSPYILSSITATSITYLLRVFEVGLSVSVTPAQVSVIDVPPLNSFTLTCTATSVSNSNATKIFTWSKQALGSGLYTELGGSVIIASSGDTSTLTASETQSGGYIYNCSARIGDADAFSDTAIVNVRGPSIPLAATNIRSTVTSFSTATISWSASRVAYTPETYTVVHGTNQMNLNQRSISISGIIGVERYSVELTQLQHGTVYYFQIESTNTIGSTNSEIRSFEVQNATVILFITKNDNSPTAGSSFTLTCSVVELVDHSGDTVVTWVNSEGQNITSVGDFTTTRHTMNQRVDYSLQFNPVKVLHRGLYTCEVSIPNVGYHDSRSFNLQVTPGILGVRVVTTGTSQVGTPHSLACHVGTSPTLPVGTVVYEWTSTCSGDCFVLRQSAAPTVSTQYLKAVDSGTHTCTITDSVGNIGNASVRISTTGVSLYHSSDGLLTNNSVVMATNGFLPGSFFCLSGRGEAGIGRWIAPNGDDYTLPGTHAFEVSVGGQNNPGMVEISVSGSDNRFPAGHWDGVYSCVIPDETGTEQIIYLGIYIVFGSPPSPVVQSLTPSSLGLYPYFTINCSSSGSAATEIAWTEDGQAINVDGWVRSSYQILREGTTSSYDNLLVIVNSNINDNSGRYSCTVRNRFGASAIQEAGFVGIEVSEHGAFALGSEVSITCSSDFGVRSIDWLHSGQVVSSTEGSLGELSIETVTENDHGSQYTCRTNAPFGVQERTINIQVEVNPDRALSVMISSSPTTPRENEAFTLKCVATKSPHLQNTPTIDWYDAMGNRIVTDGVIRLGLLVESGDGTVMRSLTFTSLDTSHSMEYRCNATIRFLPPPYIMTREAVWDLVVQRSNDMPTLPTQPKPIATDTSGKIIDSGIHKSIQSEVVYIGAGIGGGIVIVVLFVMIIVVLMCWKRTRKIQRRHQQATDVIFNNSLAMAMRPTNAAYGMPGRPCPINSMTLPLSKLQDGAEQNDFYLTPPNAYERSDFYTRMDPAGPAFAPPGPPPQYKDYSSCKKDHSDQLYSVIPGEYLTDLNYEEEDQPQDEYISSTEILHCGNSENEDTLKSDISMQEMYGNL